MPKFLLLVNYDGGLPETPIPSWGPADIKAHLACYDAFDQELTAGHSTLEFECLSRCHFATKAEARREVARFIDWYNRERKHSTCQMFSPLDYETMSAEDTDVA